MAINQNDLSCYKMILMLKRMLFLILLLIKPYSVLAHQDSEYIYTFHNVTVRVTSSYLNEEINNAKIIGKYASILSKKLQYKKPIILDFIHDYGNTYNGKYIVI